MQNSEPVKIGTTTTMSTAATPIQGGEEGFACSSKPVELKGDGDDVTETGSVDPKPLALVGHKRKASSEIDPQRVYSPPPVSSPTVEQNADMVPQGEGDNDMPHGGMLLDLNHGPEEEMDDYRYRYDDVFKENVEAVAEDNIEVKLEGEKGMLHGGLSDFDLNHEGVVDSKSDKGKEKLETGDMENPDDVKPGEDKGIPHGVLSEMDTNQGEGTVNPITDVEEKTQVETDSAENNEVEPSAIKKIEGVPSTVENTEVALPASAVVIELELNCEFNKESDHFSDSEVESKTSAMPAEKNEGESSADEEEVDADADASDKMEVNRYAVAPEKKNEEVEADAAEKVEVVPHAGDQKKKNKAVEPDAVEKVEAKPYTGKHEAGPSTTGEDEVETSPPVKVHGLLRSPVNFDLDLNQPPSMEED
ncbi:unnamed protein product [Sphenostylis stenocarpa]|uniref:Uncharacterized protein n=1 Tax=Sphenostylis stenocarpa TaxID=92480 RepID=A0AA86VBZ9_9FABA|nr:unnamed protein product [Sphenostylis stenocarpa]